MSKEDLNCCEECKNGNTESCVDFGGFIFYNHLIEDEENTELDLEEEKILKEDDTIQDEYIIIE